MKTRFDRSPKTTCFRYCEANLWLTTAPSYAGSHTSSYKVELRGPSVATAMETPGATSRGTFLGPFLFSTLRFTWPAILPDNSWSSIDETDGVLSLGLNVGFVSKAKSIDDSSLYDGLRYDPFEFGIVIGASGPVG